MEGYNDPTVVYNFVYVETNEPPVANAGADQEVMAGDTVTLHGSGSYDPNGDDITYMWAAPDGIVLDDNTAVEPTFIAPAVDESTAYEFTLVVNDAEYDSGPDNVVVTVTPVNNPPVVDDISVETDEDMPVEIVLSGSDPDGDSITFSIESQPTNGSLGPLTVVDASTATVVYTPSADFNGSDTFTYIVNDSHMDSGGFHPEPPKNDRLAQRASDNRTTTLRGGDPAMGDRKLIPRFHSSG